MKERMKAVKCEACHGTGRIECAAYYYGVAECSACDGSGYVEVSSSKREAKERKHG